MKHGYRIFDTHTHLGHARHTGRADTAEAMLRRMDSAGVERSLVMPFPVVDDWRGEHDLIGRAVLAHPDRLTGTACYHPYVDPPEFREEVRRCREQFGFKGVKLQPQYHGLNPYSTRSDFFFETALEFGMVAVCHTGSGLPFSLPSLLMMPARRFPALPIVVAHCGSAMFAHDAMVAAQFCPNIYLELSSLMPHHLTEVLADIPAERLMVGSDLPESLETEIGKISTMEMTDEARRLILGGTARRLFLGEAS